MDALVYGQRAVEANNSHVPYLTLLAGTNPNPTLTLTLALTLTLTLTQVGSVAPTVACTPP